MTSPHGGLPGPCISCDAGLRSTRMRRSGYDMLWRSARRLRRYRSQRTFLLDFLSCSCHTSSCSHEYYCTLTYCCTYRQQQILKRHVNSAVFIQVLSVPVQNSVSRAIPKMDGKIVVGIPKQFGIRHSPMLCNNDIICSKRTGGQQSAGADGLQRRR